MKKPNWSVILILFGVSLFLGYAIFTAIVHAFLPAVNNISRPFLCAGEYTIETVRSSYRPGETTWSHYIYCDGRDITLQSVGLTGLIVSLVFFVILLFYFRNLLSASKDFGVLAADLKMSGKRSKGKSPLERMSGLKEMRNTNLISQVEYERKKEEIMKEL